MQQREGGDLLQDLYLKRFFQDKKPSSTLDKVISFQKKMQDFKISKHSIPKSVVINSNYFLQEQINHFRPSTNHTSYRMKREKQTNSLQCKKMEGPATAQLRLILDKKHNGDMIIAQNRFSNNLYSANNHRKRMKLLSHRQSRQQKDEVQQPISKIDMANFLAEHRISTAQRITKPLMQNINNCRYIRRESSTLKPNDEDQPKKDKIISKKVFIGGKNLEKAAEEYTQNYKKIKENIIENNKQVKFVISTGQKKNADIRKRKVQRKDYRNKKIVASNKALKMPNSKTQPKKLKYDVSLDLNPWNVVDVDYY